MWILITQLKKEDTTNTFAAPMVPPIDQTNLVNWHFNSSVKWIFQNVSPKGS